MAWASVDGDGRVLAWGWERADGLGAELSNGDYLDATMGGGRALSDYRLVGTTAVYDPPARGELDAAGVAALVLASMAEGVRQDAPPGQRARPGYRWERRYDPGCTAVVWEEVEEPGAYGTDANPVPWEPGCACWANWRYSRAGRTYVCLEDGRWDEMDGHFEEV